jgi:hypothetical protein
VERFQHQGPRGVDQRLTAKTVAAPPQTCPSERSDNGQNEGRQKCQEKVIARNKYSISSGKSKLPLRVARVLGR